jgi:hypothetical protein
MLIRIFILPMQTPRLPRVFSGVRNVGIVSDEHMLPVSVVQNTFPELL